MSAPDFLKTSTPKDKLASALDVLREFKQCESVEEYCSRPFATWVMLEMFEEYLDHLVNGNALKPDTLESIRRREGDAK